MMVIILKQHEGRPAGFHLPSDVKEGARSFHERDTHTHTQNLLNADLYFYKITVLLRAASASNMSQQADIKPSELQSEL